MGLFDGKVAIVTGAGGGLGRAYALQLAAGGAKVVVNDLGGARDGSGAGSAMADQVVAEIVEAGGEAVANYDSVAAVEGGESIVKTAIDAFGRLDILINNAGILRDKTLMKMDEGMWDLVMAVHMKGAYAVTKPAIAQMRAQGEGGKVLNTSSYAGLIGNIGQANYGAAKAGIAGFTRVLGLELRRYNIDANAIAPMAKTRMTDDIAMVPETVTPEQIAPMALFLVSSLADGITGRIFGAHGPEVFEYKTLMTPFVVKKGEPWTVEEIAEKIDEIGRDPSFVTPDAGGGKKGASDADKVSALFHAMPKAFKADKAGDWSTLIHFDVKGTGVFTMTVGGGVCTVDDGAQGEAQATVTFDSAATILGMADGSVDAPQAFMAGKVKASDMGALMKFGQYFSMKKAAAAVQDVLADGGGEEQSPAEIVDTIFERMPEGFLPEKAEGWNTILHFNVGGVGDYTMAIEKGTCRTMKGKEGAPKCTIKFADADVMIGMVSGKLKAEQAFMAGKIKADNMGELMKFGQCFDMKKGAQELGDSGAASGPPKPKMEGLNRELLGRKYKAPAVFADPEATIAYAKATDDDNPAYTDESREGGIIAPPLYAVRPLMDSVGMCVGDKELNADLLRLVHGEQEMIFHRPLKPWDLVNPRAEVYAIEDKSSGQLLQCKQYLWADGELVNETISGYFIRGKKKGDGPAKPKAAPAPEPERDYVFEQAYTVAQDQPVRYAAASGDSNPIHTDPEIAKAAGHPNVILHGLCTMAFAQKAVVNNYLDGDPARLKRLKVRFSKIVLPGDVLTTKAWVKEQTAERTVLGFETYNQSGTKVLSNAEAEVLN